MTNAKLAVRAALAASVLGCTGLLAACGSSPSRETTTTERTTTMSAQPQPASTVTTTRTQQSTP
jgi:hypothetical protein